MTGIFSQRCLLPSVSFDNSKSFHRLGLEFWRKQSKLITEMFQLSTQRYLKLINSSQIRALTASADIRPECSPHMAHRSNVFDGLTDTVRKGNSFIFFRESQTWHMNIRQCWSLDHTVQKPASLFHTLSH